MFWRGQEFRRSPRESALPSLEILTLVKLILKVLVFSYLFHLCFSLFPSLSLVLQLLFTVALSPQCTAVSLPITSAPGAMLGKCACDLAHVHHGPACLWSVLVLILLQSVSQAAVIHFWWATVGPLQVHNWVLCCGRTFSLKVPLSFYPVQCSQTGPFPL